MTYMLLIYEDAQSPALAREGAEYDACIQACGEMTRGLAAQGKYLGGAPLYPVTTATSVRVREGQRMMTDGPFAETREQLGGYMLVEAENLDEALAIAARHPVAKTGTVEVRPVVPLPAPVPVLREPEGVA